MALRAAKVDEDALGGNVAHEPTRAVSTLVSTPWR